MDDENCTGDAITQLMGKYLVFSCAAYEGGSVSRAMNQVHSKSILLVPGS